MAGCDYLRVDIIGKGGHGSAPHLSNDPVPVMGGDPPQHCRALAAKKFDVFDPVVIKHRHRHRGQATNVIPEKCRIEAAIRTFSPENRQKMEVFPTRQLVEHICAAYGMAANVVWDSGTGPTLVRPRHDRLRVRADGSRQPARQRRDPAGRPPGLERQRRYACTEARGVPRMTRAAPTIIVRSGRSGSPALTCWLCVATSARDARLTGCPERLRQRNQTMKSCLRRAGVLGHLFEMDDVTRAGRAAKSIGGLLH